MAQFDPNTHTLVGTGGLLEVRADDEITRKLVMLMEGECEGLGPLQAATKFGYSKQRYFQLRTAFQEQGALALHSAKRGPKTNYRRTSVVVRQVIRHRFLDPDASAEVIAQKLRQTGWTISTRSVERIVGDYGLRKKPPQVPPARGAAVRQGAVQSPSGAKRRRRSAQHRARRSTATRRQDH